jgi:hypothetical protein
VRLEAAIVRTAKVSARADMSISGERRRIRVRTSHQRVGNSGARLNRVAAVIRTARRLVVME